MRSYGIVTEKECLILCTTDKGLDTYDTVAQAEARPARSEPQTEAAKPVKRKKRRKRSKPYDATRSALELSRLFTDLLVQ